MKQISIAVLALICGADAIKINSSFIDGDISEGNDNQFLKAYVNNEPTPAPVAKPIGAFAQVTSDPIHGSLGIMEQHRIIPVNEEAKLEVDLASRKPQNYTVDPNIGPSTEGSIAWAEAKLGAKMAEPPSAADKLKKYAYAKESFEQDDEEDFLSTQKSIKWAEGQFGLNNTKGDTTKGDASQAYANPEGKGDWWNYLVKDQFDGMRGTGRSLTERDLEKAGVSEGTIHDRMTEYERLNGIKIKKQSFSASDKELTQKLKAHLGIEGSTQEDLPAPGEPTPKAFPAGSFQLSGPEMHAAKKTMAATMADSTGLVAGVADNSGFIPPELLMPGGMSVDAAPAAGAWVPPELAGMMEMVAAQKKKEATPAPAPKDTKVKAVVQAQKENKVYSYFDAEGHQVTDMSETTETKLVDKETNVNVDGLKINVDDIEEK